MIPQKINKRWIVRQYLKGKDIGYYLRHMVFTYNTETGLVEPWGTGFTEEYKERLIGICRQIVECSKMGREKVSFPPDFLILKSRQTFLSWTISAILAHQLIYQRNFYGIVTSDKEESLDNAIYTDYNTSLGKVNYILSHMPEYLRPADEDIDRSYKTITYLPTLATVKGDSGKEPGRGKGVNIAFQDEIAKQQFSFSKQAALVEAVKGANVMNSTPAGKFNVFFKMFEWATKNPKDTSFQVHKIHWRDKVPKELWDAWYASALRRNNGDTARMAQELEFSFDGIDSIGRVFTNFSTVKSTKHYDPATFIPGHSFLVFDYGYGDPAVETLFTIDTASKKLVLLDCLAASSEYPQQIAPQVRKMLDKWHLDHSKVYCVGDPSGTQVRGDNHGNSFVKQWFELGFSINPADNSIPEGIATINAFLADSTLVINDTAVQVMDALGQAVWPTDSDGNVRKTDYKIGAPYTDILDTIRYGVLFGRTILQRYGMTSVTPGMGMGAMTRDIPINPNVY